MRLFANFQIEIDRATETYRTVPVRYGDANRMAMHVLKQNSENVVNSAPFISCWIQALEISPDARRAPMEIDKVQVFEKKFNYTTNEYDNELGSKIQMQLPGKIQTMFTPLEPDDPISPRDIESAKKEVKEPFLENCELSNEQEKIENDRICNNWSS